MYAKILIAFASFVIVGCDVSDNYTSGEAEYLQEGVRASTGQNGGMYCQNYTVAPSLVTETDSTSSCSYADSGTYAPYLIRAEWRSVPGAQCSIAKSEYVVGGLSGIRRKFGCSKQAPGNPVYRGGF